MKQNQNMDNNSRHFVSVSFEKVAVCLRIARVTSAEELGTMPKSNLIRRDHLS